MKVSLRVNNDLPAGQLVELAQAAEEHAFDQLWVSNDLFLRSAPALLGALASHTDRLRLGVAIMNPYSVHVSELAMIAATLQEISNGRAMLGVGAGAVDFLAWAGIERPHPLTTTGQAVAALRRLLGHVDVADADLPDWFGEHAVLRFEVTEPVPVYVGGMGPKMLRMAGRLADGALPLLYPPEHFSIAQAQVKAGLAEAGRAGDEFDLPACFWVSIDADVGMARRALAEKLAYYGPSISEDLLAEAGLTAADFRPAADLARQGRPAADLIDLRMLALGVAGGADEVIARCEGLRELGARHLSFGPPLGPDPVRAVRILGREVLPALRAEGECS